MLKLFEFHFLFPVLFVENRFPLLLIEKSADTVAFKIPKFAHLWAFLSQWVTLSGELFYIVFFFFSVDSESDIQ